MKFLNKKEQVLDMELTEYGKRLLSKGRFKPTYYAFFDDGILYDSQYAGVIESQNDAEPRIIKDTPQLETQAIFNGIESHIKRQNQIVRSLPKRGDVMSDPGTLELIDQAEDFQNSTDKAFSLTYPLGTSQLTSDKLPAWSVSFLRGRASGSLNPINALTCSNQILNIPQISTAPIKYVTRIDQLTTAQKEDAEPEDLYGDEVITVTSQDSAILLEIEEKNVDFDHENFHIEIYEIQTEIDTNITNCAASQKVEKLIPLYYKKPFSNVQNGILLDIDEREEVFGTHELTLDPSYVEYFFNIKVDNEIDPAIICNLTKDEGEGIFSQKVLDCEPTQTKYRLSTRNLFNTDATDEDCGE